MPYLRWSEWSPGLDNDSMTLGEVLATLPGDEPEAIPDVIRKYENPASADALPGAVSLARHDCIHALLGRGLRLQDEAFVIGFTMGAARAINERHLATFEFVSVHDYPKPYNFEPEHLLAFRLGVGAATDMSRDADIHLCPLEARLETTMSDLRREFGIQVGELRAYFRKEELLLPGTRSSRRLDTSARRDDVHLVPPEGERSGWKRQK
ncbi:MAG: hypothetical protein QF893_09280 [Alphaproteobacteria bacterium]|jgi:hypothetical protein|nr:hypothetical protein [Alphaproteobacteria bacterium]